MSLLRPLYARGYVLVVVAHDEGMRAPVLVPAETFNDAELDYIRRNSSVRYRNTPESETPLVDAIHDKCLKQPALQNADLRGKRVALVFCVYFN